MPQSLSNILVHIVFSTKDRTPFLRDCDLRNRMHVQIGSVSNKLECQPVVVGGIEDHIHILAHQSRTICLADWVKELKRVTSMWIKEISPASGTFAWQSGYGAFSVSQSQSAGVVKYIQDQESHHKRKDFKTEFREFLNRHKIEFDERFVWD